MKNLIRATNVKTNEVVEFATQKEATEYFSKIYGRRISNSSIRKMLEQKTLYKNTWKVRYIGDGKITKVCKYCGKEFKTTRSAQIYCDSVCSLEVKNLENFLKNNEGKGNPTKTPAEKALIHKLYVMLTPLRTAK